MTVNETGLAGRIEEASKDMAQMRQLDRGLQTSRSLHRSVDLKLSSDALKIYGG
jgi:uncharacterized protein involved in exopolysaccharide biosynthesis